MNLRSVPYSLAPQWPYWRCLVPSPAGAGAGQLTASRPGGVWLGCDNIPAELGNAHLPDAGLPGRREPSRPGVDPPGLAPAHQRRGQGLLQVNGGSSYRDPETCRVLVTGWALVRDRHRAEHKPPNTQAEEKPALRIHPPVVPGRVTPSPSVARAGNTSPVQGGYRPFRPEIPGRSDEECLGELAGGGDEGRRVRAGLR